jgi:chromosome segregation ATPase
VTAALEERVERLEQKVDDLANERVTPLEAQVKRLDTWAGPGQNVSLSENMADLRKRFDDFGRVQRRHTKILNTLTKDVAGLKTDVAGLKTDVAGLKTDVAGLKTDVAGLKTDVATLKTDVATLKTDMKDVKGALSEILDRLPPRQST